MIEIGGKMDKNVCCDFGKCPECGNNLTLLIWEGVAELGCFYPYCHDGWRSRVRVNIPKYMEATFNELGMMIWEKLKPECDRAKKLKENERLFKECDV